MIGLCADPWDTMICDLMQSNPVFEPADPQEMEVVGIGLKVVSKP